MTRALAPIAGKCPQRPTVLTVQMRQRLVIALILLATLNALLWSFVTHPGSGGPDEVSHFGVVGKMVATGGLAEFDGYGPGAFSGGPVRAQVAHEITPNAFAIPVAAVIGLIGSDDFAFNVHVARLFSVALYPATLWLAFLTFRRIFPDSSMGPVWGVTVMATVPMFTLVHSYYTNDTPAIAAGTLATYSIVRAAQSRFARRDVLLVGAALGLVGLHKYTGFVAFPAFAVALLWSLWRKPSRLLRTAVLVLGIATAICSWWYIRNWALYGDPIGVAFTQAAVDASGAAPTPPRTRGLSPIEFLQESNWLGENFATFWAGYGLEKLKLSGGTYLTFGALVIVASIGLIIRAIRGSSQSVGVSGPPLLIIMGVLHLGLWAVSFWSSYTVDVALSGRYVYPTFVAFVVLMIAGLSSVVAWRGRMESLIMLSIPIMLAANGVYFVHTLLRDVLD